MTSTLAESTGLDVHDGMLTSHLPWAVIQRAVEAPVTTHLQRVQVGDLLLVEATTGPAEFQRRRREVNLTSGEYVAVILVKDGEEILEQDGDQVVVGPGSVLAWDSVRPASCLVPERLSKQSLFIPRDRFERLVGRPERVTMRAWGISPATTLLGALLDGLLATAEPCDGATAAAASNAALELVRASCLHTMPRTRTLDDATLLHAMFDYIETHLHDPLLDPARVARHHAVSRRRLYDLFDAAGEPVWAYVKRRRLCLAFDELAQFPAQRSIASIGRSVGFTSAAHFTRAFRAHFSETPSEVRRRAAQAARTQDKV